MHNLVATLIKKPHNQNTGKSTVVDSVRDGRIMDTLTFLDPEDQEAVVQEIADTQVSRAIVPGRHSSVTCV